MVVSLEGVHGATFRGRTCYNFTMFNLKHQNETCEKMWNADESAHTFALTLIILIFNQKVAFSSLNFKINCGFA